MQVPRHQRDCGFRAWFEAGAGSPAVTILARAIAPIELPVDLPAGPAAAVLRVLPSGRATLAGVVVNGVRY